MSVSILISGNLTGFSRFYTSPGADEVNKDSGIDYDYRNYLTYLNEGEKAYVISFSPKVVAVSLVTRILDSFRRPGILVVTALIPRNQAMTHILDPNDRKALYNLLNEVNNKFYEKNFLNGMINQNPAVLMQDYYSDILNNYNLTGDRNQKPVNATIDVHVHNKNIGYVASKETDIPKYLASPMRKSYKGYHHVVLADKAPQNIDEPAEEVVTYRVMITNTRQPAGGEVTLNDRIPNLMPQQGEKDIPNKNYTYREIINGEAGNSITASIENDTIHISYHFPKEEKKVNFKFFDGATEVPLPVIRPRLVESNGTSIPLSSDSFTFYGEEIYGRKRLESGNPDYVIDPVSAILDLQRIDNGATINIYASKGWDWVFNPKKDGRTVAVKPLNITLENRVTGERESIRNVTGSVSRHLSGKPEEWIMTIESDYYKPLKIAANGNWNLEPKKVADQDTEKSGKPDTSGAKVKVIKDEKLKLKGKGDLAVKEKKEISKDKKKQYFIYGCIVAGALAVVALIYIFAGPFGKQKGFDKISHSELTDKMVNFIPTDTEGKLIDRENLPLLKLYIEAVNPESVFVERRDKKENTFMISYKPDRNDSVKIRVEFRDSKDENNPVVFTSGNYAVEDLSDQNKIKLIIQNAELSSYREFEKGNKVDETILNQQITRLSNSGSNDLLSYAQILKEKSQSNSPGTENPGLKDKITKAEEEAKKKAEDEARRKAEQEAAKIPADLDNDWLTLDDLNTRKGGQYDTPAAQARIKTLKSVLEGFKNGDVPSNSNGLSSQQAKGVNALINLYIRIIETGNTDLINRFKKELKKKTSIKQAGDLTIESGYFENQLEKLKRIENEEGD